jgi:hypothetical protein
MKFKKDSGVAGLTIFLSLVVIIFLTGLLVTIFAIMGGQLQESTYTATVGTANNETLTTVTGTGETLSYSTLRDVVCTLVRVQNSTSGASISSGNYTQSNCVLTSTGGTYNNTNWNVTYTYAYNADNTATYTMNDTTNSIVGAVAWFDIFIVIGAMVTLIFLTVLIIVAIRGSGIMGGNTGMAGVGTA